jgi:hypothetical protein
MAVPLCFPDPPLSSINREAGTKWSAWLLLLACFLLPHDTLPAEAEDEEDVDADDGEPPALATQAKLDLLFKALKEEKEDENAEELDTVEQLGCSKSLAISVTTPQH